MTGPDVPAPAHTPAARTAPTVLERLRAASPSPLLLLAFLGLAVLRYAPAWSSPATTTVKGADGDAAIIVWFLRWIPFAVGRDRQLLFSDHLNVPDGVNLMWNASMPLLGFVLSPLTWRWGPVLTFNVVLVLAIGLSAWTAYLAIRRYVPGHLAAAAGGLVFGFSPVLLGQSNHPHISFAFLVPLLLLAVDEILVRQRRPPWVVGPLLGLMAGCQLLIGEELLAATVLFGVLLLVVLLANNPRALSDRRRVAHAVLAFALAAVIGLAIAAKPLLVQFAGPQRIEGDITKANYSSDLLGFVIPGGEQLLSSQRSAEQVRQLARGNAAYLGVPLLLVLLALAIRRWRQPVVRVGTVMLLLAALLSMGPYLQVGGRPTTLMPPWALFHDLPVIASLIPSRLAMFTALFAGLLLAVFLDAAWRAGGWRRPVVAAVAVAALAPLVPAGPVPATEVDTPPFFATGAVRRLPEGSVALVLPFANRRSSKAMTWQAEAGMWFRMPGGYVIGPTRDGRPRFDANPNTATRAFAMIQRGLPAPRLVAGRRRALAANLARWDVDTILVGPMEYQATMLWFLTDLLGEPPTLVDGVYMWSNPVVELSPARPGPQRAPTPPTAASVPAVAGGSMRSGRVASTRWRMPSSWRRPMTKWAGSTSSHMIGAHLAAGR
jgi:hypothetical protein